MAQSSEGDFPWRVAGLGPLAAALFISAFYFYNDLQPELGLALLGFAFGVPMVWVILAAREAEYSDSPIRTFVPRLTVWLVIGSTILGTMQWNVARRISAIEAGFAVFYVAAAIVATQILNSRPRRPQLTALSGGNLEHPQRRRSSNQGRRNHG